MLECACKTEIGGDHRSWRLISPLHGCVLCGFTNNVILKKIKFLNNKWIWTQHSFQKFCHAKSRRFCFRYFLILLLWIRTTGYTPVHKQDPDFKLKKLGSIFNEMEFIEAKSRSSTPMKIFGGRSSLKTYGAPRYSRPYIIIMYFRRSWGW